MPRRINLIIDGLRKKQAPKPVEPDPDVVWPTMLEDEQPGLRQFRFTFFRGDTKWDAENEKWITIPEWTGALSEKGTYHWAERLTRAANNSTEDIDFKYVGNDFLLTTAQIQAEYGSEAEDKWNRMPLQVVTEREFDDKRWTMFANGMNVRLRLIKENDVTKPKFDVSPDLMEDNTRKGSWRFINNAGDKSDEYKLAGGALGKYGLTINEVGAKSICHYVYPTSDPERPLAYGIDWLDPEGIFICPFNTLDTDNYKITREPDYEADAVDGHILHAQGAVPVEIYFVFRRWAYYCRIAHIETRLYTGDPIEYIYTETCTGESDGVCASCASTTCPGGFPYNDCERYRQSCGREEDWNWVQIDCSRSNHDEALYYDPQLMCHDWASSDTCAWIDGGCHTTSYTTSDSGPYECHDPAWAHCEYSVSDTYKATFTGAWNYYGNSWVGLWWGPPPIGFYPGNISDKTREAAFISGCPADEGGQSVIFELIGDEAYEDAVQHFLAAGGDEAQIGEIVGGYNSLHYMAPSRWATFLTENPHLDTDIRKVLNRFCSTADGKLLKQETEGIRRYKGTDNQLGTLWQHIMESEFFTTYWPAGFNPNGSIKYVQVESGYCTRNAYRDVPYGIGLSPMKAGTLCAIIKVRNKQYYVWRKTDETFTERYLQVTGPAPTTKPFVSFEGPEDGRALEFYINFSGEGRKNTHILTSKQAVCQTYAHYELVDPNPDLPYPDCEKIIPFIETGAGQIELESPVYPIVSRWKANAMGNVSQDHLMRYFPYPHWYGYTFDVAIRDKF